MSFYANKKSLDWQKQMGGGIKHKQTAKKEEKKWKREGETAVSKNKPYPQIFVKARDRIEEEEICKEKERR